LETMVERLHEDHANAMRLGKGLAAINEQLVDLEKLVTNIVQVDFSAVGRDASFMTEALAKRHIKVKPISETSCRMITHYDISPQDVEEAIQAIREVLSA
jgi:threonine aldolase